MKLAVGVGRECVSGAVKIRLVWIRQITTPFDDIWSLGVKGEIDPFMVSFFRLIISLLSFPCAFWDVGILYDIRRLCLMRIEGLVFDEEQDFPYLYQKRAIALTLRLQVDTGRFGSDLLWFGSLGGLSRHAMSLLGQTVHGCECDH